MKDYLEVGKTYLVKHERKGTFCLRLTGATTEWAYGVIVAGRAEANLPINEGEKGDEITIRRSFCKFTEQPSN